MEMLAALRVWFQGKKTVLGGSVLIVCGIVGAFTGKLSAIDAMTVAGFGISICGVGAKANHFLGALQAIATAGVDLRMGNRAGAIAELRPVVLDAVEQVAPQLVAAEPAAVPQPLAAPVPAIPPSPLSGDDAMKPGPGRVATAAEWETLRKIATGEKS